MLDLEYGHVRQVIAVPENLKSNTLTELIEEFAMQKRVLKISTEYLTTASLLIRTNAMYQKYFGNTEPMIITPWLRVGTNKQVEIFLSFGATEAKPPEDVDAICDITETGTTLIQNNLKLIETLGHSSAQLIANKNSLADKIKSEKIADILALIKGVVEARKKLHIFVNVKEENLQKLLDSLPALKRPTISKLSEEGWFGVNTVIDKNEFIKIVPKLREIAQGLVVMQPKQILPLEELRQVMNQ